MRATFFGRITLLLLITPVTLLKNKT